MVDAELVRLRNLQKIVRKKEKDRREREKLKAELEPSLFDKVKKVFKDVF